MTSYLNSVIKSNIITTFESAKLLFFDWRKEIFIFGRNSIPFEIQDFMFSTNNGIYLSIKGKLYLVSKFSGYGLCAISKKGIIFTQCAGGISRIVQCEISPHNGFLALKRKRILFSQPTLYPSERLHQVSFDEKNSILYVANNNTNSITLIDTKSAKVISDLSFVEDNFGRSIDRDHNHLNCVSVYGDYILFTLHTLSSYSSAVGFIYSGKAYLFEYPGRGIHDIYFDGSKLIYCDSFRNGNNIRPTSAGRDALISGCPIVGGSFFNRTFFDSLEKRTMIRGIADVGRYTLVGGSVVGDRSDRFGNSGAVIFVFDDDEYVGKIRLNSSQLYDIKPLQAPERKVTEPFMDLKQMIEVFERDVGACVGVLNVRNKFE